MIMRTIGRIVFLLFCAAVAGCATSRSELTLNSPPTTQTAAVTMERPVVIRSIKDERIFEQAPSDPSIPSLGFEGAAQASTDVKSRAIGRKRNSFGKALGDVLLENGQTVESVVRDNLTAALQQAGYRVEEAGSASASAIVIDVHIKEFWAWFQPGFWAITLNTNIATDLILSGSQAPTHIKVHVEDSRQIATEGAWMEIVNKGLEEYRNQARNQAAGFPK